MKRLCVLILLMIPLCSCNNQNEIFSTSQTNESVVISEASNITESSVIFATDESTTIESNQTLCSNDYEVNSLDIDMSFMESWEGIRDRLGVDIASCVPEDGYEYSFSFENSNHYCVYVEDYQAYLSDLDSGGDVEFIPTEDETHVLNGLKIDGVVIKRYDSVYWAEYAYRASIDIAINSAIELDESSYTDGCCLVEIITTSRRSFNAYYLINDYVISYSFSFNNPIASEYIKYLDFCEIVGLPTSDHITEVILGPAYILN